MNKEINFYESNYEKYADMYMDICKHSKNGSEGMRIADIRKKYGLKKADIKILIKFIDCYQNVVTILKNENYCGVEIYKPAFHEEEKNQLNQQSYEMGDNIDLEFKDRSIDDFDDDCYICIADNISLISKKLSENNIDITNASLLTKLEEDHDLFRLWNRISNVSLLEDNIIMKGSKVEFGQKQQYNKKIWICGILQSCWCGMKLFNWKKMNSVLPLGLYYDYVIKEYKCVYYDKTSTKCKEERLSNIENVELTDTNILEDSVKELKENFDIEDYIKEIQIETMKLKVYREANVINKLKELLQYNQCFLQEFDDYVIFEIKTDDPDEYMKIFNSYGRSVIILEPKRLQNDVMEMIDNTLSKYEIYQ